MRFIRYAKKEQIFGPAFFCRNTHSDQEDKLSAPNSGNALKGEWRMRGRTLRIGLETDFLNGAMTGVGNYCFHLLGELMEDNHGFQFEGFSGLSWDSFDIDHLRHIDRVHDKNVLNLKDAKPSRMRELQHTVRSAAARIDFARKIYRSVSASRFQNKKAIATLDLFHAFKFLPPADIHTPVLPVIYDLSFVRFPETHPRERLRVLERLPKVVSRAPFVHTISHFSKAEIVNVYGYPAERIIVAPPAASPIFRPLGPEITRADISLFDLSPGRYLLAVGTLEPRKNLRTLIAAYAELSAQTRSRFPLAIAGRSGWGKLDLPATADRMIRDGSLRFLGAVSDATLRSLYEGARAMLLPSIYEGFGMPAVEALACGTDVIHSRDTSMDEITEEASRTIPATSVTAWAAALRELTESPMGSAIERTQRIARAKKFSWQTSARIVADVYDKIAGGNDAADHSAHF